MDNTHNLFDCLRFIVLVVGAFMRVCARAHIFCSYTGQFRVLDGHCVTAADTSNLLIFLHLFILIVCVCMRQIYIHTVNTIVFHDFVLFFASFRCPLMCTQTMCLNNTCKIFRSLRVFFYLFSLSFGEFVYYFYDHFRQTQYTTV